MPQLVTSLSIGYQQDTWSAQEALREIIANAMDGEARGLHQNQGKMTISYAKKIKVLSVSNARTTVPAKALLMGVSDSRGREDCIGTFGEGLPMALLVLARKGVPVTIYNGKEKWTPAIEKVAEYGGEAVLVINTREMIKPREDFLVEVGDLEQDEADEAFRLFLKLDPRFDEAQTAGPQYGGRILLQPEMKGRLYNKGVFVRERPDVMFGYDLSMNLNRDRKVMDEWDLGYEIQRLLGDACDHAEAGPKFAKALEKRLKVSGDCMELQSSYGRLCDNLSFRTVLLENFLKDYGDNAVPVEGVIQQDAALRLGKRGIVVPNLLRAILGKAGLTFDSVKKNLGIELVRTFALDELTPPELEVLSQGLNLVGKVASGWCGRVSVVEFRDENIRGLFWAGTGAATAGEVRLRRKELGRLRDCVSILVHEVCHNVGDDGEAAHEQAQVSMLGLIIEQLMEKK